MDGDVQGAKILNKGRALKAQLKNMRKYILAILALASSVFAPVAAFAQDMAYQSQSASTTALMVAVGGDVVKTIMVVIGIVAGIWVLIIGVSFGFKKVKKSMHGSF